MKKNIYALFLILSIVFLLLIFIGVWAGWHNRAPAWTGFGETTEKGNGYVSPKSLWDVLSLIITPLFLAIIAFLFSHADKEKELLLTEKHTQTDREIEADRMREASLQAYLDKISELVLEKGLHRLGKDSEVRNIARVKSLTALDQLDGKRRVILLRFLFESDLLNIQNTIVQLNGASLNNAEFYKMDLSGINLSGADLQESVLLHIDLPKSCFRNSILSKAKLGFVDLSEADLSNMIAIGASFTAVIFSKANLCGAIFKGIDPEAIHNKGIKERSASFEICNFQGAIYDNKTIWPDGFDPIENGAKLTND